MKRCITCLYPVTKPDLAFDERGECSACRCYAARPEVDWEARHKELLTLLDIHNGECIVPSSGGKDSTYIAMRLKELGAHVTAVTATTCYLTPIGRRNIDNLARHVRTIEYTPDRGIRKKLNRMALDMVGDLSWPEHVLIHRVPFMLGQELNTPLLFYGECPNNQYGGPQGTENIKQMTAEWVSEFAGFLGLRAEDFIGLEGITERNMRDYMAPEAPDVEAHFLGWFEPWDSHRNAETAINAGMEACLPTPANLWPHENLDNAMTGLHDAGCYRKFGYGRFVAQASVDIRSGRENREEMLNKALEVDGLFPWTYAGVGLAEVLD